MLNDFAFGMHAKAVGDFIILNNIIILNMKTVQPNLRNYEEGGALTTSFKDIHYATR